MRDIEFNFDGVSEFITIRDLEFNFDGVNAYVTLPSYEELKEMSECRMIYVTMRVWRTSKSKVGKRKVLVRTKVNL